jgi:hypothetical protein
MTNQEINDPNIWVCAWKKTGSVLSKHILYAAYIIVGLTILAAIYFGITWIVIPVVVAAVTAIPWPVYLVVGVPVIYYGYGVLWCIARDLTDGDWQSDPAQLSALGVCVSCFLVAIIAFITAMQMIEQPFEAIKVGLICIIVSIFMLAGVISFISILRLDYERIPVPEKPARFIGATINHYRSTPK